MDSLETAVLSAQNQIRELKEQAARPEMAQRAAKVQSRLAQKVAFQKAQMASGALVKESLKEQMITIVPTETVTFGWMGSEVKAVAGQMMKVPRSLANEIEVRCRRMAKANAYAKGLQQVGAAISGDGGIITPRPGELPVMSPTIAETPKPVEIDDELADVLKTLREQNAIL